MGRVAYKPFERKSQRYCVQCGAKVLKKKRYLDCDDRADYLPSPRSIFLAFLVWPGWVVSRWRARSAGVEVDTSAPSTPEQEREAKVDG